MIQVWDLFIRIYHWSLVTIVVSNLWLNEEGDPWHNWLGYTACALILLRFFWGFIGGPYVRWSAFFPTWTRLKEFIPLLIKRRDPRILTHNPLAAVAMISMLTLVIGLGISGYLLEETDRFFGDEFMEEVHEVFANLLMVLMGIHVLGVLHGSFHHKENLIKAMFTGKKKSQ